MRLEKFFVLLRVQHNNGGVVSPGLQDSLLDLALLYRRSLLPAVRHPTGNV